MRLLLLCLTLPLLASNPTREIAQKLSVLALEINQTPRNLEIKYDPFHPSVPSRHKTTPKVSKKIKHVQHSNLELSMIFNKKAFINGKWVKENQKIADYVVTKIDEDTVFLKKGRKIIKLSITKKDSILVAKEE